MNYQQQIKDPRWQKKRLEVMEANEFKCEHCGKGDEELNVHHPFYKRGAMIWEYETHELQCLCRKCHKNSHALDEVIKKGLAELTFGQKTRVLGYIHSMLEPRMMSDVSDYREGYVDGLRGNTASIAALVNTVRGK